MPSTACWNWDARATSASPDPDGVGVSAATPLIRAPRWRTLLAQKTETKVGGSVLNRMTWLGMPVSQRIAGK